MYCGIYFFFFNYRIWGSFSWQPRYTIEERSNAICFKSLTKMAYEDLSDYSEDFEDEVASTHEHESLHGHSHASISLADDNYYSSGYHSTGRLVTGGSTTHKPPVVAASKNTSFSSHSIRKDRGMRKSHGHGAKRGKSLQLTVGKSPADQSPRDRLLSAKQHAVKDLQSKLGATAQLCDDLKKENKLLRTLQARQEKELEKYQNQEGELPQILIHHSEEVRMLKEQLKRSQASLTTHQNQLKDAQQKLLQTTERNKKLEALVKKKGLLEREMLTYQLQETQLAIADKDRRISDLEKSADLVAKSHHREVAQLRAKNKNLNTEIKQFTDQHKLLCQQLKEKERDLDVLNIYSKRIAKTSHVPLPAYTEDSGTITDITCPPNETFVFPASPRDHFSNTANYSPRNTTDSVFQSTLSYPQGSDSPSYSIDNSPRGMQQQHISLSSQISREVKSTATAAATVNTGNFSPPVQATATPAQVTSRNSPGKEERLRLEESQRKEAEENRLRLQKEQEERAKVERAAEQKRLEEEKKKQLLLAKLKAIDNSQSTSPSQAETKPTSHSKELQPVKKKRLEDILNDKTTNDDVITAKPLPAKSNNLEEKRKKDLLAQLLSTDQPLNSNSGQQVDAHTTDDGLTTGGSSISVKSGSSTGSNYKWNTRIENMHQGKPAMATKDDPFGARTSASLQQGNHNMVDRNTSQKQSARDGGLDFLDGTGGVINTEASHSKKRDTPTFGRRAVQKPHAIFGSDLTTTIDTPAPLKIEAKSANNNSSKSYPWEHEVNVTTEQNSLSYLSHNNTQTDSSLLPRRIKAQPLNIGSMPGQIDDDIEELSLV